MNRTNWVSESAIILAVLLFGALAVVFVDIPNVKPVAATALFAGIMMTRYPRIVLCPLILLALCLSGNASASWPIQAVIAVGLLSAGVIGRIMSSRVRRDVLSGNRAAPAIRLLAAGVSGSLVFYLVSNVGWWWFAGFYPPDASGLIACLIAGIPFGVNTLLGDLCFAALLFGAAWAWVHRPDWSAICKAFSAAPLRS